MYNLSNRMNVVLYNMMVGMVGMGLLNYLDGYFGTHEIKDANFELSKLDLFTYDRIYDEQIAAFQFNFKADITGLINWNTNIIFASIVCEYETESSKVNYVTVWDQRIKREATEFHHLDL